MIFRFALIALLGLPMPALAADVAETAAAAAEDLHASIEAMQRAVGARDRVATLTGTIRAYEQGLDALRESLRQATIRESALSLQFEAQRDRVAQLLGVLESLPTDPGPLLLLHPTGPIGSARSGMMLAEITPALQAEAETLRADLEEIRDLRALQAAATETLAEGLRVAQEARTALSQAISERTDLPKRLVDDPEALRALVESTDTLDAFAAGLKQDEGEQADAASIEAAKGALPLPVLGTILRRPGESDAAGVKRPGLLIATRQRALVTSPWPATIRYVGPFLDYGKVMILEPGSDYLMILAGLETVYGEVGEVVPAGAALGLMGGPEAQAAEFLVAAEDGGGIGGSESLYLELRRGAEPVDPTEWFAGTRE